MAYFYAPNSGFPLSVIHFLKNNKYYMSPLVKIPIVQKKVTLIERILIYTIVIAFILCIITILFIDSKLLTLFFVFLSLASIITLSMFKPFTTVGYIIICPERLTVMAEIAPKEFLIKDLEDLRFRYAGAEGDRFLFNPLALSRRSGTFNFVEFTFKSEKYSLELYISKYNAPNLQKIVLQWKIYNPNFKPPRFKNYF